MRPSLAFALCSSLVRGRDGGRAAVRARAGVRARVRARVWVRVRVRAWFRVRVWVGTARWSTCRTRSGRRRPHLVRVRVRVRATPG